MKLTSDQISALRNVSPELADKLEAGESVTVERGRWSPKRGGWVAGLNGEASHHTDAGVRDSWVDNGVTRSERDAAQRFADDQRIFNRLHAYREEFAPGYVVPRLGERVWFVYVSKNGDWSVGCDSDFRLPGCVYMTMDVAESLASKLNSGEVVL